MKRCTQSLVLSGLFLAQPVFADGILVCLGPAALNLTVTSTADTVADDGVLTLREAIAQVLASNQCEGSDVINLDLPDAAVLTLTDVLAVTSDKVEVKTPRRVTLRTSRADRPLFSVSGTGASLKLDGLRLEGQDVLRSRAAIEAATGTSLLLDDVILRDFDGGTAAPGALLAQDVAGLQISDSLISSNQGRSATADGGGAVYLSGTGTGPFRITRTTFLLNTAPDGSDGGALRSQLPNDAALVIEDSTFAGNESGSYGGAVAHTGGALQITNSTVSGNTAADDGGGLWAGGTGIVARHVTIVANEADRGGGVGLGTGATLTGNHALIALNAIHTSTGEGTDGTVSLTRSIVGGTADQLRLGTLALNGGSTPTHLLLSGSVAIDAGNVSGLTVPAFDQRGEPRVQGAKIDIGAVEMAPAQQDSGGALGTGALLLSLLATLRRRRRAG